MRLTNTLKLLLVLSCAEAAANAETEYERQFKLLTEQRDKAISAAVEPINRRYAASLERLIKRTTQAAQLEKALEIKKELQSLKDGEAGANVTGLIGSWSAAYSKGGGSNNVTSSADGKITSSTAEGTWTTEGSRMMIKWGNGVLHRIPATESGRTILGEWKAANAPVWSRSLRCGSEWTDHAELGVQPDETCRIAAAGYRAMQAPLHP